MSSCRAPAGGGLPAALRNENGVRGAKGVFDGVLKSMMAGPGCLP